MLSLSDARDLITTSLDDTALQRLLDAVHADIRQVGGAAYPLVFSMALVDITVTTPAGAVPLQRDYLGADPPVGEPFIQTTGTVVVELAHTLTALNAGGATVTLTGSSSANEGLAALAGSGGALAQLALYVVGLGGRIELALTGADSAVPGEPDRVVWTLTGPRGDGVRAFLAGIAPASQVRIVLARPHAHLAMAPADWQAAQDRVALALLRIAVNDRGVVEASVQGADFMQARRYLRYTEEYRERLQEIVRVTGAYF